MNYALEPARGTWFLDTDGDRERGLLAIEIICQTLSNRDQMLGLVRRTDYWHIAVNIIL